MRNLHFSISLLALISLLLAACGANADPNAAFTAAASTLDAGVAAAGDEAALQTSQAENAALQATVDALATQNAALQFLGTATAIAQATLDAVAQQVISPGGAACRFGPDGGFEKVADLEAGVAYDLLGRSQNGEWWQVQSPDNDGTTCWVFWSEDLDFLGEVFNLPLLTGPVLPTPTFEPTHAPGIGARFAESINCSGTRYAIIRVINLGSETYQSAVIRLSDPSGTEVSRSDGNNEFMATANCPGGGPTLGPRQEKYVAVVIKNAPAGATMIVRVTVCTEKGMGGDCYSSTTNFTE